MTSRHDDQTTLPYDPVVTQAPMAESVGGQETMNDTTGKRKPIGLLDLPLDILQAICREFTHTNDFTAVALTHSALYDLVIPQIYSRFDIVWPDANPTAESRMGVDALTYGLATLVMAHDVFGEAQYQQTKHTCQKCGHQNACEHQNSSLRRPRRIRRGNYYAQYTKKFSLGNGPEDWVREYLITKEGGKMLGTLVALAVGRMRNLEAFTWDMPTGVLRDVWLALASLAERDEQDCKLEKVWVRWHDNSENMLVSHPPPASGIVLSSDLPSILTGAASSLFQIPPYPRVAFPTFSILPPLKSLNVLDIDELSYAEEMGVLIANSLDRLQELRVGVARHAQYDPWARTQESNSSIPPSLMDVGQPNPGGLLGVLVCRFCSLFTSPSVAPQSTPTPAGPTSMPIAEIQVHSTQKDSTQPKPDDPSEQQDTIDMDRLMTMISAQDIADTTGPETVRIAAHEQSSLRNPLPKLTVSKRETDSFDQITKSNQFKRLQLQVLELERVFLSIPVLSRAFDWTRLRSLTLLGCRNHDQLWKALRRKFAPVSRSRTMSASMNTSSFDIVLSPRSVSGPSSTPIPASDYKLKITKIHTDTVSSALLAFIKDTLAPETLECLFLQQNESYKSTVTVEQIYKYAIRPHRGSLRNLLIDSDTRTGDDSATAHWRRWSLTKELITCITSGRMRLRELSMCINYKDWHHFLQRLPEAATIRSLHVTHIADYIHSRIDARDMAQQILDVVALRPELEICYVGIQSKCFEILEMPKDHSFSPPLPRIDLDTAAAQTQHNDDDDDDPSDDDDNDDHDGDSEDHESNIDSHSDNDFEMSEDDESSSSKRQQPTLRLREILFYDDRICIFKARHGKL